VINFCIEPKFFNPNLQKGTLMNLRVSSLLIPLYFSTISYAGTDFASTIEDCTKLLPKGQNFNLQIDIKIDTKKEANLLTGNMDMTDGTTTPNPELGLKTEAFKNCVVKLIKHTST